MTYVLLPGLHGDGRLAREFTSMRPAGTDLVVVDYPPEGPFDYPALSEALAGELGQRLPGRAPVTLIGESYGGPLAVLLAARISGRVTRVILVGSFARSPLPRLHGLARRWLLRWLPMRTVVPRILLAGLPRERALDDRLRETLARVTRAAFVGRVLAIRDVDVRAALGELAVPVLYLRATRDWLVPAGAAAEVAAVGRAVRVASVPGPHMLLATAPEACWSAIQAERRQAARVPRRV